MEKKQAITPERKTKLDELQKALEERGVKDIKFFFDPTVPPEFDINEVADSVIYVVEAYLAGNYKPAERLNDSCRDRTLP